MRKQSASRLWLWSLRCRIRRVCSCLCNGCVVSKGWRCWRYVFRRRSCSKFFPRAKNGWRLRTWCLMQRQTNKRIARGWFRIGGGRGMAGGCVWAVENIVVWCIAKTNDKQYNLEDRSKEASISKYLFCHWQNENWHLLSEFKVKSWRERLYLPSQPCGKLGWCCI